MPCPDIDCVTFQGENLHTFSKQNRIQNQTLYDLCDGELMMNMDEDKCLVLVLGALGLRLNLKRK